MKNPIEELFGSLTKKPNTCESCGGLRNKVGSLTVCPRVGCRLQGQWIKYEI